MSAASVFILAHLTQLHYGNASASAPWWHYLSYVLVVAAGRLHHRNLLRPHRGDREPLSIGRASVYRALAEA